MVNVLWTDGERIYTADYEVRGTLFRAAVVTADEHHIVAPGVDKSSRDCLHVFHARTGARLHRYVEEIVYFPNVLHKNRINKTSFFPTGYR